MVAIETNGTFPADEELNNLVDLWTASPKIGSYNIPALKTMTPLQLKFVFHAGMRLPIELIKEVNPKYTVIQPCALTPFNVDRNRKELKRLAEFVIKTGYDVRVIPQLHKYIWGDKKGI